MSVHLVISEVKEIEGIKLQFVEIDTKKRNKIDASPRRIELIEPL